MDNFISVENVILPNKPLSNFDLIDAVKKLKIKNFRGVFLRDELYKSPKKKECGIINLADSEDSEGTHWVCYFNKYYFDSYGLPPPLELIDYLKEPIDHNIYKIQPINTVVCGHLCLYVLAKLNSGYDFNDIIFKLLP